VTRLTWGAVAAVGLVAIWLLAPVGLRRMGIFSVRRIDVTGGRYLSAADVARAAAFGPKANLFDDLEPARRRVLAVRGVAQVRVRRRLPGAVEFEIVEMDPVALSQANGKLVLVDRRGRPLPFDPTRVPVELPVATADSAVTGLIDRVKDADPELYGAVTSGSRERNTVVLETDKHRILFRVGATTKDIQSAAAVLAELARRKMSVTEVDARFEGRILVRRPVDGRRSG
jgi:cell division septal protein FtsQ